MMIMARYCLFTCIKLSANFKIHCKSRLAIKYHYTYFHKGILLKNIPEDHSEADSKSDYEAPHHEDLKIRILEASLPFVHKHGWSKASVAYGAQSIGLSAASHTLIEGNGAHLVHYFNSVCNTRLDSLLKKSAEGEKYPQNVFLKKALEERLKMIIPYASKWSEAMALMMFPTQFPKDTRNLLEIVDVIWHHAGDKSIDITWYGKRLSIAAVYKATELCLVQDRSPEYADTFSFLERYVETVTEASKYCDELEINKKNISEFGAGALITVRNLLGINKWLR